jgi:hypothetical protein
MRRKMIFVMTAVFLRYDKQFAVMVISVTFLGTAAPVLITSRWQYSLQAEDVIFGDTIFHGARPPAHSARFPPSWHVPRDDGSVGTFSERLEFLLETLCGDPGSTWA